ncbi:ATP-grasp domain-containing protein [Pseudoalteromonas aliena]|jgi:glutathione synthase/RimK-type ligase-like ATP-grasp enzyme|uniref:ATP-grasp domain-containing protein n=1 Tax=Pseudoalteromonas aliena SW19 TaxID=1314866 RepID=A0ABR9DV41_9GAMM|nr:hypothetical protein [Pseudoalteromonas aliena]MBE0358122.1 hypothetical protein [Pseudoalteromonas aliena SW19]
MAYIVIGQSHDEHALKILNKLKARNVDAYLLQTHDFPKKVKFSFSPNDGNGSLTLSCGTLINFSDIKAVFWRSFSGVSDEETRATYMTEQGIAAKDSMACLRTWFYLDNGTKWVNGWEAFQHHQEKPYQLQKIKNLGVKIPQTYVGNNIEDIKLAYKNLEQSIFKPVFGGAHTEILTESHLETGRVEAALAKSPITVQEFITGTNIRTYVIGKRVISIELKSELADFRVDDGAKLIVIDTPELIKNQAIEITKELYLNWTAIDWRMDKSGEYYFLEANPSPMFIGFEKQSGISMSDYIVDYMLEH